MCVMTILHVNCFACDGLPVRTCDSKVQVCTLCGACSVILPMCVMTTLRVNCVACDGLTVRTCDSKVQVCTLCGSVFRDPACVLVLGLIC